jgi:hypothetical protein
MEYGLASLRKLSKFSVQAAMVCLNKSKQCNAWSGCVPDYSIWFVDRREYTPEKDVVIYSRE